MNYPINTRAIEGKTFSDLTIGLALPRSRGKPVSLAVFLNVIVIGCNLLFRST